MVDIGKEQGVERNLAKLSMNDRRVPLNIGALIDALIQRTVSCLELSRHCRFEEIQHWVALSQRPRFPVSHRA